MEVSKMTPEREQEVIQALQTIVDNFEPTEEEPELTMFGLISRYNATGQNIELIGGDWAKEHGFDLPE
jgi:hypothetical protein